MINLEDQKKVKVMRKNEADGKEDDIDPILKSFDFDQNYGPQIGISRK